MLSSSFDCQFAGNRILIEFESDEKSEDEQDEAPLVNSLHKIIEAGKCDDITDALLVSLC